MPDICIQLSDDRWTTRGGVSACGHASVAGRMRSAGELCAWFEKVASATQFEQVLLDINGFFAVVVRTPNGLFAAVDRIRSIPLFFGHQGSSLKIGDQAKAIAADGRMLDRGSIFTAEFRLSGFVSGQDTLSPSVKQLQAGEMLVAEEQRDTLYVRTHRYFRYAPSQLSAATHEQLLARLNEVASNSIQRLIERADGRTILLPLSGGWDSRLIATLLKRHGYRKVLCFSYGRPGNLQSTISKSVADALGYPWLMVPYSERAWWSWFHSKHSQEYASYSHNLVSIPHFQDWPAIWDLKDRGVLSDETLVAPGYVGGFAAGGHIPPGLLHASQFKRQDVLNMIYASHYSLWPQQDSDTEARLRQRLDASIETGDRFGAETATAIISEWDWAERQGKFIANAVRAYEFWGVEWWMPLADTELLEFWPTVPLQWRVRKRLYAPYVAQLYADVAGIPIQQASQRDGARLRGQALDRALRIGCYALAREAYRRLILPITRARLRKHAYHREPLAWYGIMDVETFRHEFTGRENFHFFVARHVLGELRF